MVIKKTILLLVIIMSINQAQWRTEDRKNDVSDKSIGKNADPQLIYEEKNDITGIVIKKGLRGTLVYDVDIDEKGNVEKCVINKGLNPVFDSIVKNAMYKARYSPAIDNGTMVPSTVNYIIEIDPDTLILQNNIIRNAALDGIVVDKETKQPLHDAIVNLQMRDSTSDTSLSTGFTAYMTMIGKCSNQKFENGILSTTTDSAGHFQFFYLPCGNADISVSPRFYEIAHFTEKIDDLYVKNVRYLMSQENVISDKQYEVIIYGKSNPDREVINLEKQQYSSGLTHYLSKVILTKSTIRQVPEAASALLVRSGSPYDNRYLIAGIPFLSPYHFGGNPYAEFDGLMITTLNKADISVNRISGSYPEASGALFDLEPGAYQYGRKLLRHRPEFGIDFSTISQDLLLALRNNRDDYLQVGFTRAENYSFKFLNLRNCSNDGALVGFGDPQSYGNLTGSCGYKGRFAETKIYGWYAYDKYEDNVTKPWGMASMKIIPLKDSRWNVTGGFSNQYFVNGKRMGNDIYRNESYLTSEHIILKRDSILTGFLSMDFQTQLDHLDWNGCLLQRNENPDTIVIQKQKETSLHLQTTARKSAGPVDLSARMLCVGNHCLNVNDLYVDWGISAGWSNDLVELEIDMGQVTGRPDIRGLPDSDYRQSKYRSYLLSIPCNFRTTDAFRFGVQPYMRYQDKAPRLDPIMAIWDESGSTQLKGYGIDTDLDLRLSDWIELNGVINVSDAYRRDKNEEYEYNSPFSFRGRIHSILLNKLLHVYVDCNYSRGMQYYNLKEEKNRSLPDYFKVDLNVQYRSPILYHRNLTRYDIYFIVNNITRYNNLRDFYWDEYLNRHPIYLNVPMYIEVGIRLGFRL